MYILVVKSKKETPIQINHYYSIQLMQWNILYKYAKLKTF